MRFHQYFSKICAVTTAFFLFFVSATDSYSQNALGSWPVVYVAVTRDSNLDGKVDGADGILLPEVQQSTKWISSVRADLMLRTPILDGQGNPVLDASGRITYTEELLVSGNDPVTGKRGVIWDPSVSFDGEWVYFTRVYSVESGDVDQGYYKLVLSGSDIFKIHVKTRKVVQITNQKFTPLTSLTNWSTGTAAEPRKLHGRAVFNMYPSQLPGGKIIFSTTQNGYDPQSLAATNFQLAVTDDVDDSSLANQNLEVIGHLNLGAALHPYVLSNGEVLFSSAEGQGLRDMRIWALWSIWPDGRLWKPRMSGFTNSSSLHFQGELSDGRVMVVDYYNQNNNGFGTVFVLPSGEPASGPPFGDPNAFHPSNRAIPLSYANAVANWRFPFTPLGDDKVGHFDNITRFASSHDANAATDANGFFGKVSFPTGGPNNSALMTWTGRLNANFNSALSYDGQLCFMDASRGKFVSKPEEFLCMQNNEMLNEISPKVLLPFERIYGKKEPTKLSWLPNKGQDHVGLPYSTPFGEVGTSSMIHRNTATGGLGGQFPKWRGTNPYFYGTANWITQGAEAGLYKDDEIFAVRILGQLPDEKTTYNNPSQGYVNWGHERYRILGEIPVRKFDASGNPVMNPNDPNGVDTSFLARIPADVSFTFQTLDKNGAVLNMSQTWHQVRPGERRADCGGCHAHAKVGVPFDGSAASKPDYKVWDLTRKTPLLSKQNQNDPNSPTVVKWVDKPAVTVEYHADIKPIFQAKCITCHSVSGRREGGLALDDTTQAPATNLDIGITGLETTYRSICRLNRWQASDYSYQMQSRRSVLHWKIRGERTDGFTNDEHPTNPGNKGFTDLGNHPDHDLDFVGTVMPPPGSGVPPLTEDEKMTLTRWIDLGCPTTKSDANNNLTTLGWHFDSQRPTLTMTSPRPGKNKIPLEYIAIGLYDMEGLDLKTFEVTANISINGKAAGTNLVENFDEAKLKANDYRWYIPISLSETPDATITARVFDVTGNKNEIIRRFAVTEDGDDGDPLDNCPGDPEKLEPGLCGCGTPDTDTDGDETPDCLDQCPANPNLTAPAVDNGKVAKLIKQIKKLQKQLKKMKKKKADKKKIKKVNKKLKKIKKELHGVTSVGC